MIYFVEAGGGGFCCFVRRLDLREKENLGPMEVEVDFCFVHTEALTFCELYMIYLILCVQALIGIICIGVGIT